MEASPTVLVVDDDALERLAMAVELEELGYDVMEASSGDEAAELLSRRADDVALVVTDVRMPGKLDGIALSRAIRSEHPTVMVLIMSGTAVRDDQLDACHGFFEKPVDTAMLASRIAGLIDGGTSPAP